MKPPIPLDEARRLLLDGFGALGREQVPIADAAGRILAEPVIARHDQPQSAISAMDGYAVRSEDVAAGTRLRSVGESPAGAPFVGNLGPGECVKIATGGIVPDCADRIILQENVTPQGEIVVINDAAGPSFVRPAAMDFGSGQSLVEAGQRLTPAAIGLAAAAGRSEISVYRSPRVAILSGGDELREPGERLAPGATYNSAAYAVAALVEAWGGTAIQTPILPDDIERIIAAIRTIGEKADIFVPLGGASVGERDLFRAAFEAVGAQHKFWRIAVIPGKPSWHARMPDGRAVLGLPGNPSSAFVCAHLLLRPLIERLSGADPGAAMSLAAATLVTPLGANGEREAWLRANVSNDATGSVLLSVDKRQDSGLQTPLLSANALVRRLPGAAAAETGARVEFLPITLR